MDSRTPQEIAGATPWPFRHRLFAAAIVAYFLFLAAWGLERESYWADEIFTLRVAEFSWPDFWQALRKDSVHPPLHYIAAKLTLGAPGDPLLNLRWLSILSGAATLMVLCLGRHFAAALLVASNAWFIHYSQEVRGYAFLFLGVALTLWCLEKNKASWLLFLAAAWTLWSHYFGILYLLAAIYIYRDRWRPAALALATLIPWALYVSPRFLDGQVSSQLGWIAKPSFRAFYRLFSKLGLGWNEMLAGVILLLSLLALAALAWRREDKRQLLWATAALAPPLTMFFFAQIPLLGLNFYFYRYFLVSMIPAALLWTHAHPRARFAAIGVALLLCLPYTLDMRRESARFDSIRVARDLQAAPHPPVYAWDTPFNAAPINLYCRPACVEIPPQDPDKLPPKFWLLSWPEDRDVVEFDWRGATRSRGYQTKSVRLYPRRPDFQLHGLEIIEYERR